MEFSSEQVRNMVSALDQVKELDEILRWMSNHRMSFVEDDGEAIKRHYGQSILSPFSNGDLGTVVATAIIAECKRRRNKIVAENPVIIFPDPPKDREM